MIRCIRGLPSLVPPLCLIYLPATHHPRPVRLPVSFLVCLPGRRRSTSHGVPGVTRAGGTIKQAYKTLLSTWHKVGYAGPMTLQRQPVTSSRRPARAEYFCTASLPHVLDIPSAWESYIWMFETGVAATGVSSDRLGELLPSSFISYIGII